MNLTVKSSSGKSYFTNKLGERLGDGRVLNSEQYLNTTREMLEEMQDEYRRILSMTSPDNINRALEVLKDNKKKVHSGETVNFEESLEGMDEETRRIFEIMKRYQQEIKQLFIDNGEIITHITNVSPEDMIGGKIAKSLNRANNYETESGDWVFASSEPIDGKNAYLARKSRDGMILIDSRTYIYGGDNMRIQQDEQGENHVVLKEANYVYKINPENFTPVVTLKIDKQGNPYFEFSEEWTSEQDINIDNPEQVRGVEKISDVTDVVKNYQVLCDVNRTGEAMRIRSCKSREQGMKLIREMIASGRLRYINGEANINPMLEISPVLSRSVVTAFAKQPSVIMERENVAQTIKDLEYVPEVESAVIEDA